MAGATPRSGAGWQAAAAAAMSGQSTVAVPSAVATPGRRLDFGGGMTPPAKRPMAREAIQVSLTGERPMSHEELTSGFYQLLRRVEQEEALTSQMHEAVVTPCTRPRA